MKHGFELHGFFLEPKSAYLEALLYMIHFKNVDCKTQDFSPLIKKVLAGVEILCWQNVKKIKIDTRNVCHQKLWSFFERKNGKNEEGRTDITTTNVYSF